MSLLNEITERFKNGEHRYSTDEIFKTAIDSLRAGLGVYAVLDRSLRDIQTLREVLDDKDAIIKTLRTENAKLTEALLQSSSDYRNMRDAPPINVNWRKAYGTFHEPENSTDVPE